MRILLIESDAVIEGEQLVGALADLGVNPSIFEWELSKLDVGDFHLHFEREEGPGKGGVAFTIHPGATHQEHAETDARPPSPALNVSALRELVENSELSVRSKALSLGLLADLDAFARADRSPNGDSGNGGLSEPELVLLAQVVLVAVGIDQLGIDQVEVVRTNPREQASPEVHAANRALSLDPLIAALQTRLPRTGSPTGLQRIQTGVGVSVSAAGHQGARIEAFLLEG